jgi:hypothetical protein
MGVTTVNCGSNRTYTITPVAHHHIVDVLVDGASVGALDSYTFTDIRANHTIEASFAPDMFTLTTAVQGQGTITVTPMAPEYAYGTVVQLIANPPSWWQFMRWEGDASGTAGTINVTMDQNRSITAVFSIQIYFDLRPSDFTLGPGWVRGDFIAPPPFSAANIDGASIRLNGTVAVDPAAPVDLGVFSGFVRLSVRFLKNELGATLPLGELYILPATGMLGSDTFFGSDGVRLMASLLATTEGMETPPAGNDLLAVREVPATLAFARPTPNPSSGSVQLRIGLPRAGEASVGIYDLAGRQVATLMSGVQEAGWHDLRWNGEGAAGGAGVYFALLRVEGQVLSQRIVRMK